MKKIKIIATIGPKTAEPNILVRLFNAGMSIARLNGAHNTLDWHKSVIKLINKNLPNVPILIDIPGKKIRTKSLIKEPKFKKDDVIILNTEQNYRGTQKVAINHKSLHQFLSKNDRVFGDDGTLAFVVTKINANDIYCRALHVGQLKSTKGLMCHM